MGTHNFKTFFASAAVTAMVLSVPVSAKAKKGSITKVAVTNLPSTTFTLKKGKKKTLKFKVTKKGKISKALAYKTSNKKVVTVSKKGVVKAKKKGKATVTAYAKANKKKKVSIKVIVGTPVSKIKLNKTKATLKVGKTVSLKATVSPKGASYKKVLWKTSNKKIATVSSTGKVKAKKKGSAKITATAADGSGKKATAKITVKAATKKKTTSTKKPAQTTKKTEEPAKPATPTVVATTVSALQVKDPRTVAFTLTRAQALTTDNVKLEVKTTEAANYRKTLKIKSMKTTDNINYEITLKKDSAVGNDAEDHNVRLTVTGLENSTAPFTIETLFRKGKIDRASSTTKLVERGTRVSFQASVSDDSGDTYSIESLPAGLKQDPNKDGVTVFGVVSDQKDQDVVVKETDVYGNTYTKTTHLKFYDDNTINGYASYSDSAYYTYDDTGYYVPTVNDNGTEDNFADDSLETYVYADVNVDGGQTYSPEHYEKTGKQVNDYDTILGYKEDAIVYQKQKVQNTEADSNDQFADDSTDETTDYEYNRVYGDAAAKAYKLDDQGKKKEKKDADGNIKYATETVDGKTYNILDQDGNKVPEYELNDGYKVEYTTHGLDSYDSKYDDDQSCYYNGYAVYGQKDEEKLIPEESTHYEFVSGDTTGLTLSADGHVSGKISGSRTVVVRASRKDKAGNVTSVDVPVTFNVADAKLVKGTVTDSNGKGVQGAIVSANNNDYNTKYSGIETAYTNTNGQYEFALLNNGNYDVTVSRNASDNFYASQSAADTMNYKLDGVQYNVTVNDQTGQDGDVSHTFYDSDSNEEYYMYDNYNSDTKTHNATIFADKPNLSLVEQDEYFNGNVTIANGTATATIYKK